MCGTGIELPDLNSITFSDWSDRRAAAVAVVEHEWRPASSGCFNHSRRLNGNLARGHFAQAQRNKIISLPQPMVDHVVVVDQLVHSITSRPMRRSVIIQLFLYGVAILLIWIYVSNYEVSVQQPQQQKYVEGEKFRVDRHLPCNF